MKLLRRLKEIQLTILTMSSSVLIAACYGAQYAGEQISLVVGRVTGQDTSDPVENVEVCLEIPDGPDTVRTCATTDAQGNYEIVDDEYLEQLASDRTSKIVATDVDGDANGAFQQAEVDIPPANLPMTVDVEMEPATN